jgi:hypothetical protein
LSTLVSQLHYLTRVTGRAWRYGRLATRVVLVACLKEHLQNGIIGHVARKKTTIYLEPDLLTATKTLAASSGRREYEVIEDALRAYMRSDEAAADRRELRAMLDRWSEQDTGLGEDEALELATREVHAYRRERGGK